MSINYNDRTGVLGINLTPQFNNSFQTAGLFGFGKSDEEKALEQIQDLRKQENQIKGLGEGAIELKQNELQNIQNQIENLKKQYPNDSSIQSASLPSNRYTADLRNLNDRMTDIPDRLSRNLDVDLINKVREYNPNYDRYTDQEITELGIPIFNKTMPSSMNSGVTNANNFRSMFLDDLRNLPSDLRTSLGQTKDALVEDFSGLGSFLKDKSIKGFDFAKQIPGMAISAITGVPFLGQGLVSLLSGIKESPTDKVGLDYFGGSYDPYGYKSDLSSGNLGARQDPFGRNIVSADRNYEQNRINELKELTRLQNLGILNNKFKQNKLDFAQNYLEKVRQEREQAQRERARQEYADVYASADRQGFTGPGGGFDTSAADKAGTSEGSGQFESRSSRGRQGY